jgi:2-aminoethylphosphonate-pyruvate transaminase
VLNKGLAALGIMPLLSSNAAGPIIQTFLTPRDPNFKFEDFYERLRRRGFAIYPGKLTQRDSFRVGTIGHLDHNVMERAVDAIKDVLAEMNVTDMLPRDA